METVYVWEPITTDKVAIRLLTTADAKLLELLAE
jgi:hypothetical protein